MSNRLRSGERITSLEARTCSYVEAWDRLPLEHKGLRAAACVLPARRQIVSCHCPAVGLEAGEDFRELVHCVAMRGLLDEPGDGLRVSPGGQCPVVGAERLGEQRVADETVGRGVQLPLDLAHVAEKLRQSG